MFCSAPKLIHRDLLLLPSIFQCFKCNVKSNLVSEFEAIGNCLGSICYGDMHHPTDCYRYYAVIHITHPHYMQWRVFNLRSTRLLTNSNPDLVW